MTVASPRILAPGAPIQERVEPVLDGLLASLPDLEEVSVPDQRGIIARYAAVLEGNFIYWMTGAYLSVKSEEARSIILLNLREEVKDCHPGMLRRFAIAARAVPTASDALAVWPELTSVRLFVGRLSGVPMLVMMAFFEGFIQRFMPYLAELARLQGSNEMEYTDVHSVCDLGHTQELYRAIEAEISIGDCTSESGDLFEGMDLLRKLLQRIVSG
jgi:hypothetical protein